MASRRFPPAYRTVERGHGRIEHRSTRTAPAPPTLRFPHAEQVVVTQRHTTDLAGGRTRTEVAYGVTSLTAAQASPERVAELTRNHWQIEICQAGCAYGM